MYDLLLSIIVYLCGYSKNVLVEVKARVMEAHLDADTKGKRLAQEMENRKLVLREDKHLL
jgi:hypothetical protein